MLRVRDIMTTDVVTVSPQATLREVAELLAARHVSGVPVVEGGRVVGVVSASDVLAFHTSTGARDDGDASPDPADRDDPSLLALDDGSVDWSDDDGPPAAFFSQLWADARAEVTDQITAGDAAGEDPLAGHTVDEVMTRHVLAIPPTVDVASAADRMRTAEVHRVLVMDDDELLGIVSSMDLVRAVADQRIVHRTFVVGRS